MSAYHPVDTKNTHLIEPAPCGSAKVTRSARRKVAYGALAIWIIHAAFAISNAHSTHNQDSPSFTSQVASQVVDWKDWAKWHCKPLPKDPRDRALAILSRYPIIDGHIDLPIQTRVRNANHIDEIDLEKGYPGAVDIDRLRAGKVGGFFWSAYTPCPADGGYGEGDTVNFTTPFNAVRDTLEQIDVTRLIIDKHHRTFDLSASSWDWRRAIHHRKIGGMIGIEGGHQVGNSLATLRAYYALGARYLTLTHTCNNAIADSCGYEGAPVKARWGGLSPFGKVAIKEMNRIGMLVDLSHTHADTASQALSLSLAPPIFSHSNARGVHNHVRNVPDSILRRIGRIDSKAPFDLTKDGEKGKGYGADTGEVDKVIPSGDSIIMVNYSPDFVSETGEGTGGVRANITLLADHIDYIGKLAGRHHVGVGSDLDGIAKTPEGLEDASKYPDLVAELIRRGWTDREVAGFASENLLRVLAKAERVAHALQSQGAPVQTDVFEGREDIGPRAKHPW